MKRITNLKFYKIFFLIILLFSNLLFSQKKSINSTKSSPLSGPYLGQQTPGMVPEIFAPGIVSTNTNGHSPAIFSKDGNDLFWSYYDDGDHVIMHMQQFDGKWRTPEKFITSNDNKDGNPFFSANYDRLIFHSARREKRKDGSLNMDFWYVEKEKDNWSNPKLLDFAPNSERWQIYGCQVKGGHYYFTSKLVEQSKEFQLFKSTFNGKKWERAELMGDDFNKSAVNWTPYVSPDESYIIFSSDRAVNEADYNTCDLYISFKNSENKWTKPINMGDKINTDVIERFPWVSPDGKYLFFVRGFGDVYWVSTDIIEELKSNL